MCPLILFSLKSNDLLKHKNFVIKTCFKRGFEFIKKNFICKEKSGTAAKVKLLAKTKKLNHPYFGTYFGISLILIVKITHKIRTSS